MKRLKFGLLIIFLLFGAINTNGNNREQIQKLNQFLDYLLNNYVEVVDAEPLVESAINAILSDLDPHSSYYNREEMQDVNENLQGEFSGIGVEFNVMNDTLRVVNTITGGPAEKVGVLANDRIIEIDSKSAIGLTQSEIPKLLRGEKGTRVGITVQRRGMDLPLKFTIIRDNIPIHTVDAAYLIDNKIGYIKVNRFGESTMEEFNNAFSKFPKVENLILDLRGNGGGLLSEGIEMANFFLPKGALIVSTEGDQSPTREIRATKNGKYLDGNLVVIIDGGSASASEIVAGAIQDWDRGIIVGDVSFGKGLVQRQYYLEDGSAVRITISRYHTPSGRAIQRPYTNGESEDYYQNREREEQSEKEKFKTLRLGREVYGGGGITPDIEILGDTTTLSVEYSALIRHGVINNYTISFLDLKRSELLKKYTNVSDFETEFEITNQMIEEIIEMGRIENVDLHSVDIEEFKNESKVYIKALIAQRLYSSSAFYEIINHRDTTTFSPIIRLFDEWESTEKRYLNGVK